MQVNTIQRGLFLVNKNLRECFTMSPRACNLYSEVRSTQTYSTSHLFLGNYAVRNNNSDNKHLPFLLFACVCCMWYLWTYLNTLLSVHVLIVVLFACGACGCLRITDCGGDLSRRRGLRAGFRD